MSSQLWHESGKSKASTSWLQRMAANLGFTSAVSLRQTLESAIAETPAEEDQSLSPQERTMLLNVLAFGEARVAEVMIPRADIVAIEDDRSVAELLRLFASVGHARVPVFRSSLDNPIGMVHIKDAVTWALQQESKEEVPPAIKGDFGRKLGSAGPQLNTSLADAKLIREVLFVPPSMPALVLLAKMKAKQIHLALVVDEFGGTDGLVTFEDLAEEIVGDISDEHDSADMHLIDHEGEAFVASARTPIEDVEQVLGLSLVPSDMASDIGTLGGLILAMVGSVPKRGQIIPHQSGVTFEILDAGPRRLHSVRILKQRALSAPEKPLLLTSPEAVNENSAKKLGSSLGGVKAA